MPWHIECYNREFNHNGTGRPFKNDSAVCESKSCTLGGMITTGQNFEWSRRPAKIEPGGKTDTDSSLVAMIVGAVEPELRRSLDIDGIAERVYTQIQARLPQRVEVKIGENAPVDVGTQHKSFGTLVKALAAGVNVWLTGPSGSGKTSACRDAAKALGTRFYFTGAMSDAFGVTGYQDATGRYVRTPAREAWENGGVWLVDEIDGCDPAAMVPLHSMFANREAAFPDGIIPRHPDCIIVAAANTWGNGCTSEYVGRLKQDAATTDRFAFLQWDYDDEFERAICPNPEWVTRVQDFRARVKKHGIRHLVTPRASLMGASLLAAGLDRALVETMVLRKGLTDEQWSKLC